MIAKWHQRPSLAELNQRSLGTMVEHLGIEFTEIGDDFLKARMPVDRRTKQPAGLLHGGASVTLAETLGSTAANLVVDRSAERCVGLEINANHLRSCTEGWVEGITKALHIGRTTQVWEITLTQDGRLVCISRITMSVLNITSK